MLLLIDLTPGPFLDFTVHRRVPNCLYAGERMPFGCVGGQRLVVVTRERDVQWVACRWLVSCAVGGGRLELKQGICVAARRWLFIFGRGG